MAGGEEKSYEKKIYNSSREMRDRDQWGKKEGSSKRRLWRFCDEKEKENQEEKKGNEERMNTSYNKQALDQKTKKGGLGNTRVVETKKKGIMWLLTEQGPMQ